MKEIVLKTDKEIQEFMILPQKTSVDLFSNEQHIQKVIDLYNIVLKEIKKEVL